VDTGKKNNARNAGGPVNPLRHRTRLVTIVAILLAVETAGLLTLALMQWLKGDVVERVSIPGIGPSPFIIIFSLLAVMTLIATAGFFRLWPAAWITAVSVQGISLMLTLVLYVTEKPAYVYWIMIYCMMLVAYLNHSEVRSVFQARLSGNKSGESDE
jgi:hypothetical protein